MFNLIGILTYLEASIPSSCKFSQEDLGAVLKDPSSRYMLLCLIAVIAMAFFHTLDLRELQKQHQRQQKRLAALEDCMIDITGGPLPEFGCPFLDEDDDFKLPPPAYESHEGIVEN